MANEQDLLNDLLRLQGEVRSIEQEDYSFDLEEPVPGQRHAALDLGGPQDQRLENYSDSSPASIPKGTLIIESPGNDPGGLTFADHPRNQKNKDGSWTDAPCTNGTNCIGSDFCYSDYDCDACQECVNYECIEKDANRPCSIDGDCPCNPSDDQSYVCDNEQCKLTCRVNEDCPLQFACNLDTFLCEPGCESDEQCDPDNSNAAPDARSNSICVNFECVRPCEPDILCNGPNDLSTCPDGTYCTDRVGRAPGDATNAIYACENGCTVDSQCPPDEFFRPCDSEANPECEDERVLFPRFCVANSCERPCSANSDCATEFDEGCVEGRCQSVGAICLADSDCGDGQFCNADGRCESGCQVDQDCRKECPPLRECEDTCGPEPTCTCAQIYGDESLCDPNDNSWQEFCERDQACLGRCPRDPSCLESYSPNAVCSDNSCIIPCPCEEGQRCETPEGKTPRCVSSIPGGTQREVCWEWTEEEVDADGNIEIVEKQQCAFVSPKLDDDYFGCNCGEKCTTAGSCAPGVCTADSDCESCSYCDDGVCVPGCDQENPCPAGECCQTDGKCHNQCSTDGDCPDPEMCLAGGCCGIACDPIVNCNSSADCQEGEYCSGAGVCEGGCRTDSECFEGEVCFQFNCEKPCPCGEGEVCENGFCVGEPSPPCQNDDDCGGSSICQNGSCESGCRTDEECSSGTCVNGTCLQYCIDDAECRGGETDGQTSYCRPDQGAREAIQKRYAQLQWMVANGQNVSSAELQRYQALISASNPGKCQTVSDGPDGPEGRTGCECFESCDEEGRCKRTTCANSSDCECGDCLTDGLCGLCRKDSDCTNGQVCDINDGDQTGTCATPCIPDEPCESDGDCPFDAFCRPDPFGRTAEEGFGGSCTKGCRDSSTCLPGQSCYKNECLVSCSSDAGCNTDFEKCIGGVCLDVGFTCLGDGDCPSDQSWCLNGYCEEDIRCNSDDDCFGSEVCGSSGMCQQGNRCSTVNDCRKTCESSLDCGNKSCSTDEECTGEGESCQSVAGVGICVGGANFSACSSGVCTGGSADNQYCDTRGVCQKGEACNSDDDCNFPKTCFEGGCQFKRRCNGDSQCQVGEFCDAGYCAGDNRCNVDDDCVVGYDCNPSGRCFQNDNSEAAIQVGCEGCQTCNPTSFRCETPNCKSDDDCVCGECFINLTTGRGECRDPFGGGDGDEQECDTDSDCENGGKCKCEYTPTDGTTDQGQKECYCVECRNDQDCSNLYGEDDLVCVENVCETPCYTGLSTGDCFTGLNYGDTCGNCEDKCPPNSVCTQTQEVCGTYDTLNLSTNKIETRPILCRKCVGNCLEDSNCRDGAICEAGFCKDNDGTCDTDAECQRFLDADGIQGVAYCLNNKCEEGTLCIGNSDCDPGSLCSNGGCQLATCTEDTDCSDGKKCVAGQCGFACNVQALVCECSTDPYDPGLLCPEGYECNCETNLCSRDGYPGIEPTMDEESCPRGTYCDTQLNGCRPFIQGQLECFTDTDCDKDDTIVYVDGVRNDYCEKGICKRRNEFGQEVPPGGGGGSGADGGNTPPDNPNEQDNCQKKGLCCGNSGFCTECDCSEENPCRGAGECCDPATSKCVSRGDHPVTKYGAPEDCRYGEVFCEVLTKEGDSVDPSQYKGRGFPGCEFVYEDENGKPLPEGQRRKVCWDGLDPNFEQTVEILTKECKSEEQDQDCACDDVPPEEDECFEDLDCGNCMVCEPKTWWSTPCCPVADVYGNDQVTKNLCKPIDNLLEAPEECGCVSDSECGPCEVCKKDGNIFSGEEDERGVCAADCENLCPDGGSLSDGGNCPTCKDRYGECAEGVSTTVEPAYVDEFTGKVVPAKTVSSCRLLKESDCCVGFGELNDDMKRRRDACEYKTFTDQNGNKFVQQVDYCLDFRSGTCAECTEDSHCSGSKKCKGYICVSECGDEDAIELQVGDCSCCTDDGECKELYESWSETRDSGDGAQSRPCACTENGTDCGPYQDANSCYKWVKNTTEEEDQAEAERKANRDQQLEQLATYETEEALLLDDYRNQVLLAEDLCNLADETPDICFLSPAEITRCENEKETRRFKCDEAEDLAGEKCALLDELPDACESEDDTSNACQTAKQQIQQACDNARDDAREKCDLADEVPEVCAANSTPDRVDACETEKDTRKNNCNDARTEENNRYNNYQNNLSYQAQLEKQLEDTVYRPAEYQQVRTCNCCLDGQCRPDDECTYGTCYLCVKESTPYYRAALYTNVLENEVCTGCTSIYDDGPAPGGCPEWVGGPNAVYFNSPVGDCVKYRCEDGISTMQEICTGSQNSWYDYCYGSVIGCVFSCDGEQGAGADFYNYWNGWEYTIDCEDAGTYFYNGNSNGGPGEGDWVKLTFPQEQKVETSCAYPNPLGCIQGNWIPTFVDLVQISPCCHKAEVISECDPEHPGCQTTLEIVFEPGLAQNLIDRLEKQVQALEKYLEQLEAVSDQLLALEETKNQELRDLKDDLEAANEDIDDLKDEVDNLTDDVAQLESDITTKEGELEDADERYQNAVTELEEATAERNEKLEERDEIDEELKLAKEEEQLAEDNYRSASNAAQEKERDVEDKKFEIYQLEQAIARELCEEEEEQSLKCFNLYEDLLDAEDLLAEYEAEYEELIAEKEQYFDEWQDLRPTVRDLETDLNKAQSELDTAQSQLLPKQIEAGEADRDRNTKIEELTQLNLDLLATNQELAQAEAAIERAENPTLGEVQDLEEEIAKVEDILENIVDSKALIEEAMQETQTELNGKESELERLQDEYDVPVVPVAATRPDDGKTQEDLKEIYEEVIQEDKDKLEDTWYPDSN